MAAYLGDDSDMDEFNEDDSDGYSPEVKKPKAKAPPAKKAAAAKAAPGKKMMQTTLTGAKGPVKKRLRPDSDDEADDPADSYLADTPPSAKKQKKATAPKKSGGGGGKPLGEIENDNILLDDQPRPKSNKTNTEKYQKLSQLEHIILRPDTYIGSVERTEQKMWVFNKETKLMENRTVSFVPGLYKIFDEIIVNAADNRQNNPDSMTHLKVTVDREAGEITVENNGKGIPVEIHEKEGIYIPEMIFGHLLAGSNFDDNEKKVVGGRNGYGAKLCNVFSTKFTLECQDAANGKRYKQTWTNNMTKMEKAKITANKTADFVKVTFRPDFKRFGMEDGIDDDLEALIHRRVYDMAGTNDGLKVFLNGEQLKVNFQKYCEMYAKAIAKDRDDPAEGEKPAAASVIFEDKKAHRHWQVGFTVSDGTFQQVSFVNSIATTVGGTHVNYIADQICEGLLKELNKKKKGHSLKASHMKNYIFIFINCRIVNPAFSSQTKEQMTTRVSSFGSKCDLTDGFLKKIRSTEAIANIMHFADKKADKLLAKADGSKRARVSNDKLVDANLAGTKHGHECTLILTEGDSAKGLAISGRAILDPDRIGVFPLRGKMLNVRDASIDQIMKNKEIQNIKQFLGLKHKATYHDTKSLRYGHLMIMADQDHDGSHIKGLLINFLEVQFPSLLRIPDFFREFITPVVKVWQGPNPKKPQRLKSFFTLPQYEEWKLLHQAELRRWHYKYFKGLGTSSNEDAQVYFTNLDDHLKEFETMKQEESQLLELAFSKKKADERKEWLGRFVPGTYLDHSTKQITYSDFVNRELILFSMADNIRSIPSVVDGFKPGQRKVLHACFKRNLVKDQKVIELAGYVSEQTAYHHGEASLQQTIIGLAQNFVGSNNVNCLEPSGNFGSRLAGGSDAASARYIHTRLSPFARRIFSAMDEPNLDYQFEDGKMIEPKTFAPILPMVLVNGADGIGTGWSTSIPNYHPLDIVTNLKRYMGRLDPEDKESRPFQPMMPWWRGWKGEAGRDGGSETRFKFNGVAKQDDRNPNEVVVSELPIRMWTDDFKAKLEEIIRGEKSPSFIKDYKEFNDHKTVNFVIQMEDKHMDAALKEGLLERFKLLKSVNTTNLVAFNVQGQIHRYSSAEEILQEFYDYRFHMYTERREHWLKVYDADLRKLKNQYRFIQEIIDGKMVVAKKKKAVLVAELRQREYEAFPPKVDKKVKSTDEELDAEDEPADDEDAEVEASARDYDYLLSMPIWSLTTERLERLKNMIKAKKAEYDELDVLDEKDLWCRDLDGFVEEWNNQMTLDAEIQTTINKMGRRASKKIGAGKGRGRAGKVDDDYNPGAKKAGKPAAKPAAKPKVVEKELKPLPSQRFQNQFDKKKKRAGGQDGTDDHDNDLSDDDFSLLGKTESQKPTTAAAAAAAAVEATADDGPTAGRTKRAVAPRSKYVVDDDSSDDDFLALGKSEPSKEPSQEPAATLSAAMESSGDVVEKARVKKSVPSAHDAASGRQTKRAAAVKKSKAVYDDDSELSGLSDVNMLGDVGSLVKGIGAPATQADATGRLSLFAMSRPDSASQQDLPKSLRTKPSKSHLDTLDDHDETNYEALAMSSPRKSAKADNDDLGDFLSDDDLPPAVAKAPSTAKASAAATSKAKAPPLGVVSASSAPAKKGRGRPAGAKTKDKAKEVKATAATAMKPAAEAKAKAQHLSPAAKAYAAKLKAKRNRISDEDEDEAEAEADEAAQEEPEDPPSPVAAAPARRGRPGRAAAAKAKPVVIHLSSDEDSTMADAAGDGDDSDAFSMDESE